MRQPFAPSLMLPSMPRFPPLQSPDQARQLKLLQLTGSGPPEQIISLPAQGSSLGRPAIKKPPTVVDEHSPPLSSDSCRLDIASIREKPSAQARGTPASSSMIAAHSRSDLVRGWSGNFAGLPATLAKVATLSRFVAVVAVVADPDRIFSSVTRGSNLTRAPMA